MTITIKSISRVLMITVLLAVAALMVGAVYTYRLMPPVPDRVVATDGTLVYTGADIAAGKEVFQRRSLMDYGTLLGNGGYFGPDFTAEYLEWMIALMQDRYARDQFGRPFTNLPAPEQAAIASRVRYEWKHTAYRSGVLTVSLVYAAAHREIQQRYARRFVRGDLEAGIAPGAIRSEDAAYQFADFVSWTAWFAAENRPGRDYSYTSNWPYIPALATHPSKVAATRTPEGRLRACARFLPQPHWPSSVK